MSAIIQQKEMQLAEYEVALAQQELNRKSSLFRKKQLNNEISKLDDQIDASMKQTISIEEKIKELNHGG